MHSSPLSLLILTSIYIVLLLPAAYAEPSTTSDNYNNIVFQYNGSAALKFARRGKVLANKPCGTVGGGGLRYNSKIKKIEYCDGSFWQTPPDKTIKQNLAAAVNYKKCSPAICDTGRVETNVRLCQYKKSNVLRTYYQRFGATGSHNIHLACPKDMVFVGSDFADYNLPSSYISAFCCSMNLIYD